MLSEGSKIQTLYYVKFILYRVNQTKLYMNECSLRKGIKRKILQKWWLLFLYLLYAQPFSFCPSVSSEKITIQTSSFQPWDSLAWHRREGTTFVVTLLKNWVIRYIQIFTDWENCFSIYYVWQLILCVNHTGPGVSKYLVKYYSGCFC